MAYYYDQCHSILQTFVEDFLDESPTENIQLKVHLKVEITKGEILICAKRDGQHLMKILFRVRTHNDLVFLKAILDAFLGCIRDIYMSDFLLQIEIRCFLR